MKALLYKEFRLAMHPMCYVFVFLFPLLSLIPKFPLGVGFIYLLTSYPILFLGANKGQQSNDLLYSTLLPVRKKDIVKARIVTVSIMHFVYMAVMAALIPLVMLLQKAMATNGGDTSNVGITADGFVSLLGIALIGFALADLIFFPIYYRHGKSIVTSTLLTIIGFVIFMGIFTIMIPLIPAFSGYKTFLCDSGLGYQFIVFGAALVLYVALHLLVYRICSRELERVDF